MILLAKILGGLALLGLSVLVSRGRPYWQAPRYPVQVLATSALPAYLVALGQPAAVTVVASVAVVTVVAIVGLLLRRIAPAAELRSRSSDAQGTVS